MKTFYSDQFVLPLPDGHRFPMAKYRMLRERVAREVPACELRVPEPASDPALLRVHEGPYVEAVRTGLARDQVRRVGFPWSPGLIERSRRSVGGTVGAALAALEDGVGVNLAGGTHHAFADAGEGFCVFNDVAVAARALQAQGRIARAAVLDLDVHQGNGTARIFRDDASVLTVSVHGAANYPFRKEESDLDLPLEDGAGDAAYLSAVDRALEAVLDFDPELVFYIAGADPFEDDRLGRLAVSRDGLEQRDVQVFERLPPVPAVVVMGGGYAHDVSDTVAIHLATIRTAARALDRYASARSTSR